MTPRKVRNSGSKKASDATAAAVAAVRRLVRVLRLSAQRILVSAGIGPAQVFVLQHVGDGGAHSLNDLAARTLTDRSSVAEVVDRLVEQGLVSRQADAADRRRASVRITAAGRRLLARAPEDPGTALVAAIQALAPRDRAALAQSVARLNAALGAAHGAAPLMFADVTTIVERLYSPGGALSPRQRKRRK